MEGRIRAVKVAGLADAPLYACEVMNSTGVLTATFYGRRSVPGLTLGALAAPDVVLLATDAAAPVAAGGGETPSERQ